MDQGSQSNGENASSASYRRYNVQRSCLRCHKRKVQCNKLVPCSTCIRAKAQCYYPGPERAKRRSQQPETSPLSSRVERLEEAIVGLHVRISSNSDKGIEGSPQPALQQPSGNVVEETGAAIPSKELLVKDGATALYMNELVLSGVLEKECELQCTVRTSSGTTASTEKSSTFEFDGLISNPLLSTTKVADFYPACWQATQLWQIYLNNVDPLLKILHLPTMQPAIFSAINHPEKAAPDLMALLFSIYYAATTSVPAHEVPVIFGHERQVALRAYQRGLEISLSMGSFLDTPTLHSLQAMSIYVTCTRSHSSGRSGWVLNGLLIRAAQSVGLHRDGQHFSLSPLDSELRRRLWWQIVGSDARVGEDHGLCAGPLNNFCDTDLPLNVNDSDLGADILHLPNPQSKWTEMTMFLVLAEMNCAFQQIYKLFGRWQNHSDKTTRANDVLRDVKHALKDKYLRHCDPNIPIQRVVILVSRILLGKIEVCVRQKSLIALGPEQAREGATDDILALACDTVCTANEISKDELLTNFHWHCSSYTQYHLLTYILWHLCVKPDGPKMERAWHVVNSTFQWYESQLNWRDPGPKWHMLCKMREKALLVGQSSQPRDSSLPVELTTPTYPEQQAMNTGESSIQEECFGDGMIWDLDSLFFPDELVSSQNFSFHS